MKTKSENSACEIYLAMMRNPPVKKQKRCHTTINEPILAATGEILLEEECQIIERRDKKALLDAEVACKKSLGNHILFKDSSDNPTTTNYQKPRPR